MSWGLLTTNPTTSQRLSLEQDPQKPQQQRAHLPIQHKSTSLVHFVTYAKYPEASLRMASYVLLVQIMCTQVLRLGPGYCGGCVVEIVAEGYCQQKYSLGCPSILAVDSESRLDRADSSLLDSSAFSLLRYSPSKPLALVLGDRVSNVTYES